MYLTIHPLHELTDPVQAHRELKCGCIKITGMCPKSLPMYYIVYNISPPPFYLSGKCIYYTVPSKILKRGKKNVDFFCKIQGFLLTIPQFNAGHYYSVSLIIGGVTWVNVVVVSDTALDTVFPFIPIELWSGVAASGGVFPHSVFPFQMFYLNAILNIIEHRNMRLSQIITLHYRYSFYPKWLVDTTHNVTIL